MTDLLTQKKYVECKSSTQKNMLDLPIMCTGRTPLPPPPLSGPTFPSKSKNIREDMLLL